MKLSIITAIATSIGLAQAFTPPADLQDGTYVVEKDADGNEFAKLVAPLNTTVEARHDVAGGPVVNPRGMLTRRDQWGV